MATERGKEEGQQGSGLSGRGPPGIETEARGELPSPENDGVVFPKRGLEVAGNEAMEDGVGDEEKKPESDGGIGMMVEGVVGVPIVDDLVVPPWRDSICRRAGPKRTMESVQARSRESVVTQIQW